MDPRRKILVVDDAELFRDLESLFLARSGHVITACDGPSGLALARTERPAVAVVDLHMPGLEGDSLCQAIKSDPDLGDIPVVLVTSGRDPDDHERAVRAGADDVVTKPLNRISLIQVVNRLMRPPELRGLTRVSIDEQIRIRCTSEDAWGTALNLSRGGIYVSAARRMPPDTEVELEFSLPESVSALSSTARVVWTHSEPAGSPDGMGMRFLGLDRSSAERIEEFVYTHAASSGVTSAAAGAP